MSQPPTSASAPKGRAPELGPSRRRDRQNRDRLLRRAIALAALVTLLGVGAYTASKAIGAGAGPFKFSELQANETRLNVLVIGEAPAGEPVHVHADALHLLSLDLATHRAFVLSVPTSMHALVHNSAGPVAEAIADGVPALQQVLGDAIAYPVHASLLVSAQAARGLFNDVGASEVFVDQALKANGVELAAGWQHPTPDQAVAYAWAAPDEAARIERQQELGHLAQARFHASWHPVGDGLSSATLAAIDTTFKAGELDGFVRAWRQVLPEDISFASVPGEQAPDGGWLPRPDQLEKLIAALQSAPVAPQGGNLAQTIEIAYAGGADEKVLALAAKLGEQGFQVIHTGRQAGITATESTLVVRGEQPRPDRGAIEALEKQTGTVRLVRSLEPTAYGAQLSLVLGKQFFR